MIYKDENIVYSNSFDWKMNKSCDKHINTIICEWR